MSAAIQPIPHKTSSDSRTQSRPEVRKGSQFSRDTARQAIDSLNTFPKQHQPWLLRYGLCAQPPNRNRAIRELHALLQSCWLQNIGSPYPGPEVRIALQEPIRRSTQQLINAVATTEDRRQLLTLLHHLQQRSLSAETQSIALVHRFVIRLLRHTARKAPLAVDGAGWASIDRLLEVINRRALQFQLWKRWTEQDLIRQTQLDDGAKLEVSGGNIRARYGHSIDKAVPGQRRTPPQTLYHGTGREHIESILNDGLHAEERYLVHLTSSVEYANSIATKFTEPTVLQVQTFAASKSTVLFWQATEHVWQSTPIPARFIRVVSGRTLNESSSQRSDSSSTAV